MKKKENILPHLSDVLFWDTEKDKIDLEKHADYVIERVVNFGTLGEWKMILNYFGEEIVRKSVCGLRNLDNKTLNYLSFFFNIPREKFRCYTNQQSFPTHYPY